MDLSTLRRMDVKLKVIGIPHSLEPNNQDVYCLDEDGKKHLVDFLIDGSLPPEITSRDDLIGKTIEVDYLYPFVEIAASPRLVG